MVQPLIIAASNETRLTLLPALANRHGLITGATGTGKTVTLQKIAEELSLIGVPVFLADVKGDLSGLGQEATLSAKLQGRLDAIGVTDWQPRKSPLTFWDVFAEQGHPIRATVSDMGPLLIAQLLNLNETQSGILQIVFRVADDNGLLLIDMKDLRAMVQFVGDNAKNLKTTYGNISPASVGAIQRGLLTLEEQGAEHFFGEPMLDIFDLLRCDEQGHGVINLLSANKLYNHPKLYSMFLLWLLSELFERLPEVGDLEKPKLVFFFDEAHLLFNGIPAALLQKIELVVRLIRSKGVGVYFVTQNPMDIPDSVLGQLGNRVQHALRAFTPRDQKAVKAAAQTMRANPAFSSEQAIMELGVGEALVSFLDEKGRPTIVERAMVIAPGSTMGAMPQAQIDALINHSALYGKYEDEIDRESAYEKLNTGYSLNNETSQAPSAEQAAPAETAPQEQGGLMGVLNEFLFGKTGPRGGHKDGLVQTATKTASRQIANQIGKEISRGILGGILGGRKRR